MGCFHNYILILLWRRHNERLVKFQLPLKVKHFYSVRGLSENNTNYLKIILPIKHITYCCRFDIFNHIRSRTIRNGTRRIVFYACDYTKTKLMSTFH